MAPVRLAGTSFPGVPSFVKYVLGIHSDRSLPNFSSNPIDHSKHVQDPTSVDNPVILYADTFTGYLQPDVTRKSKQILNNLGYDPVLPRTPCCGRPYMSKGFLNKAKQQVRQTIDVLDPFAREGIPIVALEPSCFSVLTDDLRRYAPGQRADRIAEQTELFTGFLNRRQEKMEQSSMGNMTEDLLVHGHCHQKALVGKHDLVSVLEATTRGNVSFIDSGCCGLAGSFGYEREHYNHSQRMANRKLIPTVQDASKNQYIVAPGISCRQQIEHFSNHDAKHPAEILSEPLNQSG